MKHIMIAIETLGVHPGCSVLAIGAVPFDLQTGECKSPFFTRISRVSNLLVGLGEEAKTLDWWQDQDDELREFIFSGTVPIGRALKKFNTYIEEEFNGEQVCAWGNSSRFDLGIFAYACRAVGVPYLFDNFIERDFRTLMSILPEVRHNIPFDGVRHNPVDDAYHEIKCTVKVHRIINDALAQSLVRL